MSEHLCTLSTGDKVYFYDKSIVIYFQGARKVLSTSLYNGGYHDDYTAVYNYDAKQGAGMPCEMLAGAHAPCIQAPGAGPGQGERHGHSGQHGKRRGRNHEL